MKKLLIIIAIILLTSCSSNEKSNFRGCKYKVERSMFFDTEITVLGNYAPIDLYIIMLNEIIENKDGKGMKINITETNTKYLSREDVSYIKERGNKISEYDNMISALNKAQVIVKRIKDYK